MTPANTQPLLSPDGSMRWTGQQWVPFQPVAVSPVPVTSPDGLWRWDGSGWQPAGPMTPTPPATAPRRSGARIAGWLLGKFVGTVVAVGIMAAVVALGGEPWELLLVIIGIVMYLVLSRRVRGLLVGRRPVQVGTWWNPYRSGSVKAVALKWTIVWAAVTFVLGHWLYGMRFLTQVTLDDSGDVSWVPAHAALVDFGLAGILFGLVWLFNVVMCSVAVYSPEGASRLRTMFWIVAQVVMAERGHQRREHEAHREDQQRQAQFNAEAIARQAQVDAGRAPTPVRHL